MAGIDDIRQRTWDFALTIATVALLGSLGVQSFVGTIYVWVAERASAAWSQSAGYAQFVTVMNAIAAPQVVALIVVMGLCVPKRMFARTPLLWVSLAMVAAGTLTGVVTRSLTTGLAVYLALAALIQVAVVALTIAGTRGPSYLTQGRLTKTGSGLLHLGFIVFAFVVVALQDSAFMAPVFWTSAVLASGGTLLSFYAEKFAWHRSSAAPAETDEHPIWSEEPASDTPPPAEPGDQTDA